MSGLLDDLFEVLGNETRRRILEILAQEPAYLNQLSRELKVSQQAILKHLEYLQNKGFITSFVVEEGGTPPKKYYKLADQVVLFEELTRDLLDRMSALKKEFSQSTCSITINFDELSNRLNELTELSPSQRLKSVRQIVNEIEQKMEQVARIYAKLGELRLKALEIGREALKNGALEPEERRVIYRTLVMDEDELRDYFEQIVQEHKERAERMMRRLSEMFGLDLSLIHI